MLDLDRSPSGGSLFFIAVACLAGYYLDLAGVVLVLFLTTFSWTRCSKAG